MSMPSRSGASAPPQTMAASPASRRMPSNAAACWPRVTSGPMRVSSRRGSPTLVLLSLAASASATASALSAGTKMRRIAVHFCPAFTVISRTTSRTKASKAALPGAGIRRQQRRVDAVGFDIDRHAPRHHVGVAAHARRRIGRAGERDHVVRGERVEQITGAAAEQAQRTVRQDLGGDHVLHHGVRQQARSRRQAWRAPARRRAAPPPPSPTAPSSGN